MIEAAAEQTNNSLRRDLIWFLNIVRKNRHMINADQTILNAETQS
jgi:hypothetical protein